MSVQVTNEQEAREALEDLGRRRRDLREQEDTLREDTEKVLRASRGHVTVKEACKLAGLNRSTVYELYLRNRDEEKRRGSNGGPPKG